MQETHKYNMGVIGNCAFMAYVDDKADVKWLCWPRFDSSFIFGGLLDEEKGGRFSIIPEDDHFSTQQSYITNTNILQTNFETNEGAFRVTDFAPRFYQYNRYYKPLMFIRKIEPLRGTPSISIACDPVGDYGQTKTKKTLGSNHIRYAGLDQEMRLTTNIPLNYVMEESSFVLNETMYLVLTYGVPLEATLENTAELFLQNTTDYWINWVKSTSIGSFYQDRIIRSALILKIHQYEDTGAIIAAGSASLPEFPQSTRNWDYRYCWMRDTYYTLTAFNNIGHFEEVEKYFHYIENVTKREEDRYQPLYKIDTSKKIIEKELELSGYMGDNKPVRIGNDAYTHIQNDVYGQVLVSLLPLYTDRRFTNTQRLHSKRLVEHTLQKIEDTMNEPDAGLWEFRNLAQLHCYTFLFHWAGSSAAYKIASYFKDEAMAQKALRLKNEAAAQIEKCKLADGTYAQAVGSQNLDASCLQLITMQYLDPSSEAAKIHLKHMEEGLKSDDGLFYRYKHEDDFGAPESTFLICAYWYIEALACVGRVDEAIKYFERLDKYKNHLGLLSEDVDAKDGSQWGNFPQAYSHVGQVNAAYRINQKLGQPSFI